MDRIVLERMLDQGTDNLMLRYSLGKILLQEGHVREAIAHFQRALEHDPQHSASWKLYAKALTQAERQTDAAEAYERGIAVAESRGDVQAVKEMRVFLKRLRATSGGKP